MPYVLEGTIHHRAAPGDPPDRRPSVMIPEMISTCLEAVWNSTIAVSGDREYKGSDVLPMIKMYANRFVAHGLHPGQRVWARLHNTLQNWAASMGVIFAGGVLFLSSNSLIGGASINLLVESGARYILTDEENKPLLQQWIVDDARTAPPRNLFTYLAAGLEDDSSSSGDEKRDFDVYNPKSNSCIGFVLYTPGYTGPPKGVEFSHRAYVTAFRICRALGHVGEGDVYLAWSPLAHAFGFTLNVFPMFLGAVVVFQEPTLTFRELKNVLETRNVTAMFCFPKIILRVFRDAKERKRTAGDWRRTYRFPVVNKILVGGQWIPEHLPKKLKDRFGCQRLWRYYGLTETLGVVIESEYTGNATRFRGFVAPKVRAKYMPSSDEYEPCPPGVDGELCVMSPTMMTGYYKCKEKAAAGGQPPQFGGGDKYGENTFLRTGDYGWCNHKGYIELHGKVGDIMSLSGLTVLPHELEDALRGLTFIKEICVFGSLSESVPGAAIVPKYDLDIEDSEAERQVADFLRRKGAACLTGGLCFVESIPRLEDGRVLRRAICVIQKSVGVSRPPSVEP